MVKKATRRPAIKTLSIIKSRDIVVDKLLKPCEDGTHTKCTGWAVLKEELSPINANYFLKCTCICHRKRAQHKGVKMLRQQRQLPKIKKKTKGKISSKKYKN